MTDGRFWEEIQAADREEAARRRGWLLENFEGRCDDYDPDCPVCRQWRLQDEWEKSIGLEESPDGESHDRRSDSGVPEEDGRDVQSPDDEESPDGV